MLSLPNSKPAFRDLATPAVYSTTFAINPEAGRQYVLDLGEVYFTAEVVINGQPAGKKIWNPYQLDITRLVKNGKNTISVAVMPVLRNHHLAEGQKENPFYANFKEAGNTYMPAGLKGPVVIKEK